MTIALLISLVVLGVAAASAALLGQWDRAPEEWPEDPLDDAPDEAADARVPQSRKPVLPLTFVGYRMSQVDEVVDRLQARIAENERTLATLTGTPVATDPDAGWSSSAARAGLATLAPDTPADTDANLDVDRVDEGAGPATRASRHATASAQPWWSTPLTRPPGPARHPLLDALAGLTHLLFAGYVLVHLLLARGGAYLSQGVQDQQAFEWYYAASAANVRGLANPLFSTLQNAPDGVNLMANAAMIGLGIPLTPLTLIAGPFWTFALIELFGLAGTAFAWYWLFSRRLGVGRGAAWVGGWLCGFGPAMISHANGHPNFVAQALVPVIIHVTLRLLEGARPVRTGVLLGLVVAWQIFIGEEVLLLAAFGMTLVGLVLLLHRRLPILTLLPGAAVGAAVCLVIVAYPLWWQFSGPQSYTSLWHPDTAVNDLAQLWNRATRSIGVDWQRSVALSMNRTEENSFFGIPLLLVGLAVSIGLGRRHLLPRALGVAALISMWLSLGAKPLYEGEAAPSVPALAALLSDLPLVGNVVESRFSMMALPMLGALLALGCQWVADRVRAGLTDHPEGFARSAGRAAAAALAALALIPVFPTPLLTSPRPAVPALFTDGGWRDHFSGGSLLVAPPPGIADARGLEWQMAADMGFPLVEGYFVGPDGRQEGGGRYGAPPRPLSQWLMEIHDEKVPRFPTAQDVTQFRADLAYWRTDAIVLAPGDSADALRASLSAFLGDPRTVGGVELWDVRGIRTSGGNL